MKNSPKQYAPDKQTDGAMPNNPGVASSDASGSRDMGDANEDPGDDDDGTTGTDRDKTGSGENMATES